MSESQPSVDVFGKALRTTEKQFLMSFKIVEDSYIWTEIQVVS